MHIRDVIFYFKLVNKIILSQNRIKHTYIMMYLIFFFFFERNILVIYNNHANLVNDNQNQEIQRLTFNIWECFFFLLLIIFEFLFNLSIKKINGQYHLLATKLM